MDADGPAKRTDGVDFGLSKFGFSAGPEDEMSEPEGSELGVAGNCSVRGETERRDAAMSYADTHTLAWENSVKGRCDAVSKHSANPAASDKRVCKVSWYRKWQCMAATNYLW